MATPIFQEQSISLVVPTNGPSSFDIPILDKDGNTVDVSTGYTLQQFAALPASDANEAIGGYDLKSAGTVTFGDGFLRIAFSYAQAGALGSLLPTMTSKISLAISNDSAATLSRIAQGTLSLDPPVAST